MNKDREVKTQIYYKKIVKVCVKVALGLPKEI